VAGEIATGQIPSILPEKPLPFEVRTDHTYPRDVPLHKPLAVAALTASLNGQPLRALRPYRVDLTRLADEVMNITKLSGDWHLARVNLLAARERFYLDQWRRSVERRLGQLDLLDGVVQSIDLLAIFVLER
jgi:hypothetical protein